MRKVSFFLLYCILSIQIVFSQVSFYRGDLVETCANTTQTKSLKDKSIITNSPDNNNLFERKHIIESDSNFLSLDNNKSSDNVYSSSKTGFFESFEGTFPPTDWEVVDGSPVTSYQNWVKLLGSSEWGQAAGAYDGEYFAHFSNYINDAAGTGFLVTPSLAPTTGNATFSFWFNYFFVMGTYGNSGELYIDVYKQGIWYTSSNNIISGLQGTGWHQTVIDLSNYLGQDFTNEVIKIRFRGISDYGSYDVAIDQVEGPSTTASPTNLVVKGLNNDYSKIPQTQLINSVYLKSNITNTGADLLEDVTINYEVLDFDSNSIFATTALLAQPLAFQQSVDNTVITAWDATTLGLGTYTINYEAIHESDPDDKTDQIAFEVTDYIYARDIGIQSISGVGSNTGPVSFGTIYEITQEAMMSGVQIHWPNLFDILTFNVALYKVDNNNNVISTVFTSGDLVRNNSMAQQIVDYQTRPVVLPVGRYMLAVKQLNAESIRMGIDEVTHGKFYIADNASNPTSFNPQTDLGNITLRMNLEPRGIATFTITEQVTGNEIANAIVVVKQVETEVFNGTTNAEGEVEAWLTYNDNYKYSITAPGYYPIDDIDFEVTTDQTINISMNFTPSEFELTPMEKDFGIIYIGNTAEQIFAIENIGGDTLRITNIEFSGDADFSFSGETTSELRNGETLHVIITYAPTQVGAKTATMIITHDADSDPVIVPISGEGYNATINITEFWTETFEDDSDSRPYWTQIKEVGNADWIYATGSIYGSVSTANNGVLNARFVGQSGTNSPITKLISPPFDVSALTDPAVEFYYGQKVWEGDQNELKLYYRVFGGEWIEIAHYTNNVDTWAIQTQSIPNSAIQLAFEGINNYGFANVIDDVKIFDNAATEIASESMFENLSIYPNPTAGLLTIDVEESTIYNIVITDITGKIVYLNNNLYSKTVIDILNCSKGLYILKIEAENQVFTKKIIKNE